MRVLHIALNQERQTALCDALASLGEYKEVDWIKERAERGLTGFKSHLIRLAKDFVPDVTFMQLQGAGIIDTETAQQIPGFRINWTGDVRQPLPDWYIELGRVIDLTLFTNTADVDRMRAEGLNADYLQIGFDPKVYDNGSWGDDDGTQWYPAKTTDIVFMGNHYGSLYPNSKLRYDMAHHLHRTYGERFKLYGGSWDIPADYVQHNTKKECEIYQRAKIAINCSHFDLGRYSSDRIHSIMASGTFCLTKYYPGIEEEFTPGEHVGVWHDLDELMSLTDFFLKLDNTREGIAAKGYELVHSRDTWAKRIEQLKTMLPI